MSRRTFLTVAGTGAAAMTFLAACPATGPAPADADAGPQAPAAQAVVLDFFAWGDQSDIPAWTNWQGSIKSSIPM